MQSASPILSSVADYLLLFPVSLNPFPSPTDYTNPLYKPSFLGTTQREVPGNSQAKPAREASRPVMQVGELQTITHYSLLKIHICCILSLFYAPIPKELRSSWLNTQLLFLLWIHHSYHFQPIPISKCQFPIPRNALYSELHGYNWQDLRSILEGTIATTLSLRTRAETTEKKSTDQR